MIKIFIYGELVAKRNLQLVIDSSIRMKCMDAVLLSHKLVTVNDETYGVKEDSFSTVRGLVYYMDEDQVKTLMNYYGVGFRLSSGVARINKIDSPVKYMLCTSMSYSGWCNRDRVEQKVLAFSSLYTDNENEKHYVESVILALFPGRDVTWIASNYPYYLRWLRSVGYDSNYMLSMVESEELPTQDDIVSSLECILSTSKENINSIVKESRIVQPITLELANTVSLYAKILLTDVNDVYVAMKQCGLQCSDSDKIKDTNSSYDMLSEYCKQADNIEDSITKRMFLLFVLRYLHLPLIRLSDVDNKQMNAYILNEMYIDNLLEG